MTALNVTDTAILLLKEQKTYGRGGYARTRFAETAMEQTGYFPGKPTRY